MRLSKNIIQPSCGKLEGILTVTRQKANSKTENRKQPNNNKTEGNLTGTKEKVASN